MRAPAHAADVAQRHARSLVELASHLAQVALHDCRSRCGRKRGTASGRWWCPRSGGCHGAAVRQGAEGGGAVAAPGGGLYRCSSKVTRVSTPAQDTTVAWCSRRCQGGSWEASRWLPSNHLCGLKATQHVCCLRRCGYSNMTLMPLALRYIGDQPLLCFLKRGHMGGAAAPEDDALAAADADIPT